MKSFLKQLLALLLVPILIGFVGAVIGAKTTIAVLEVKVNSNEDKAEKAANMAGDAHKRINFFHAGG